MLQCRVRPGAFREHPGSLGNKYRPRHVCFDLNFESLEGLEWLYEDSEDVVVCSLMVRELGPRADATVHRELVQQVRACGRGPEFHWIKLCAAEFERQGSLICS